MWDGLFMLLSLSAIMAIASFFAGILPLSFSLSPRQLRFMTLLGTGVLVGTSLIVIIPEGIETMYSVGKGGHSHSAATANVPVAAADTKNAKKPAAFLGVDRSATKDAEAASGKSLEAQIPNIIVERTPSRPARQARAAAVAADEKKKEKEKDTLKEKEKDKDTKEPTAKEKAAQADDHPAVQKGGDDDSTEGHKEGHTRVHAPDEDSTTKKPVVPIDDHETEAPDPHKYIGVSLILGFILMFLVDHLPEALAPSKPKYTPLHISLSDLSRGPHNSSSLSLNAMTAPASPMPERALPPPPKSSTTIGLVIHAFADGIALGASSTAPSTSLNLIIFFAIMLHKAPAAFGLTSVLLKQGLSKRTARGHLLLFSLAAPAGAVTTWGIVRALGRARLGGDDGLTWTTGWVLLFSGGTFLYVAMHSMTEATSPHYEDYTGANGYIDALSRPSGLSKGDVATVLSGMLLPLLTQVGHVH